MTSLILASYGQTNYSILLPEKVVSENIHMGVSGLFGGSALSSVIQEDRQDFLPVFFADAYVIGREHAAIYGNVEKDYCIKREADPLYGNRSVIFRRIRHFCAESGAAHSENSAYDGQFLLLVRIKRELLPYIRSISSTIT